MCCIYPKQNTKLMGIHSSSTGFFSLCEAEDFRRITPFLDRPDVMAQYTVTLHANGERYLYCWRTVTLLGEEAQGFTFKPLVVVNALNCLLCRPPYRPRFLLIGPRSHRSRD
jgi:hypothetical protein